MEHVECISCECSGFQPPQPEAGWEERFDDLTDETHYCHDLTPNDCKDSGHLKVKYRPLKSFISQELSRARKESYVEGLRDCARNGKLEL